MAKKTENDTETSTNEQAAPTAAEAPADPFMPNWNEATAEIPQHLCIFHPADYHIAIKRGGIAGRIFAKSEAAAWDIYKVQQIAAKAAVEADKQEAAKAAAAAAKETAKAKAAALAATQ